MFRQSLFVNRSGITPPPPPHTQFLVKLTLTLLLTAGSTLLGATLFAGTVFAQENPSQEGGFGDWFIEAKGNWAWSQSMPWSHTASLSRTVFTGDIEFESNIKGGSIAVGRKWDRFRFSVSYLNRSSGISQTNSDIASNVARVLLTGSWDIEAFLANAYYDLPFALGDRVRPYIGFGAGAIHSDLDYHGYLFISDRSIDARVAQGALTRAQAEQFRQSLRLRRVPTRQIDGQTWYAPSHGAGISHNWRPTWHVSAGVNIELNDNWSLPIGYRYMGLPGMKFEAVPRPGILIPIDPSGLHFMEFGIRYSFSSLPWLD